jgi:hypothetical protein
MARYVSRRRAVAIWMALVPLAAGVAACGPSAEDCRNLMPVAAGLPVPAETPAATRGCKAVQEGVTVQVEAVRRNLGWERGRIWVDGAETPESDLPSALLAARARHAASDLGAKAGKALRGLRDSVKSFHDGLRPETQGQQELPKPAPPPPPHAP